MPATALQLTIGSETPTGAEPQATIHGGFGISSLGTVLVALSDRGICAILLGDEPAQLARDLERRFPHARLTMGHPELEQLVSRVLALVEAPSQELKLPLDPRGTAFQRKVWEALGAIPAGQTVTYGEIAQRIGAPSSTRAVARACGANPLAVAIPCHRVVRQDGGLAGYRWGITRKRALLGRESQP